MIKWRMMGVRDLKAVCRLANAMHFAHPEDSFVLWEKFKLFNFGCHVLEEDDKNIVGYVFSHPSLLAEPPLLNKLMDKLPEDTNCLHFHDVAIHPDFRNRGHARPMVGWLINKAKEFGLTHCSLVSVNNTVGYWERFGFLTAHCEDIDKRIQDSYGNDAVYMIRKDQSNGMESQ